MRLLGVCLTYRTVPLSELERFSLPTRRLEGALPRLLTAPDVLEAVPLSTCNRTEVYAWAHDLDAAEAQVRTWLERVAGLSPTGLADGCAVIRAEEALRHLFLVTAGLDSMARGEAEIQGQVRRAYAEAARQGAVGPHLHRIFQWSLEAGKRARKETGLSRVADSLPGAAVRAIDRVLGGLRERSVLVVGSGKVAGAAVRALAASGARTRVVARRRAAAAALAARWGASDLPFEALPDALARNDATIFATAAPGPLVGRRVLERALARRDGPLLVVDLGMPRNVDPAAAALEDGHSGFALFDLDRLDRDGFTDVPGSERQLARATTVVLEEADRCTAWLRSRPSDAVIAALQGLAERVSATEAERALRSMPDLDERERAVVQAAIRRGIRKIVHLPTTRVRQACSHGDRDLLEAARWLFSLGEPVEPEERPTPAGRTVRERP